MIRILVINQKSSKMDKFKYILFVLIAALIFVGCDDEDVITFSNSDAFVKFEATQAFGSETGKVIKVVVQVSDVSRNEDITVDFDFNTDDIDNQAIVGDDFEVVNTSQTLTFVKGQYQDTIFIKTIDNDLYEKDKAFNIVLTSNSADYKLGLANSTIGTTVVCTIVDDEHPLAVWVGTYQVFADSYGDVANGYADGAWDESWVVITSTDPEDVNNLILTGIAGSVIPITGVVDLTDNSITLTFGDTIGDVYGEGDMALARGTDTGSAVGADIVGILNVDGSISIDLFGIYHPAAGWVWDSFNTIWTK